jgi:hypothetical protein
MTRQVGVPNPYYAFVRVATAAWISLASTLRHLKALRDCAGPYAFGGRLYTSSSGHSSSITLRRSLEISGRLPVYARALGIAPRTLLRARKALGVRTVKDGFESGWVLSLPDEECQDAPKSATSESGTLRQSWQPSDAPTRTPPAEADMLDIHPFLRRSAAGGPP